METDLAADHHFCHSLFIGICHRNGSDKLAAPQHCTHVSNFFYFLELVCNEKDSLALFDEPAHDLHEFMDFLRREHRCRFVENEDFCIAEKHFENFNALLHADRYILDFCARIDCKSIQFRNFFDFFLGAADIDHRPFMRLHAENNVFSDGEVMDELEMLVHHTDTERGRDIGVAYFYFLPSHADRAAIWLIQSKQDAHQCGFPGAVFAKQSMN